MSADMNRALEEENVLVDFPQLPGFYEVGASTEFITEKSVEAVNKAMSAIKVMVSRVTTTIESMPQKPAEVEVSFGIILNTEVGALISKVGAGTEFNVRLLFDSKKVTEGGRNSCI